MVESAIVTPVPESQNQHFLSVLQRLGAKMWSSLGGRNQWKSLLHMAYHRSKMLTESFLVFFAQAESLPSLIWHNTLDAITKAALSV